MTDGTTNDRTTARRGPTDRGVSVTVNYALNLVVATVLIAGLLTATSGMVQDHRREAARSELRVVGQRLSADLQTADRLARSGGERVAVQSPLPERVAGVSYTVHVAPNEDAIVLRTTNPAVTVRVGFATATTVNETTISGGTATVVLADGGTLEVRS